MTQPNIDLIKLRKIRRKCRGWATELNEAPNMAYFSATEKIIFHLVNIESYLDHLINRLEIENAKTDT